MALQLLSFIATLAIASVWATGSAPTGGTALEQEYQKAVQNATNDTEILNAAVRAYRKAVENAKDAGQQLESTVQSLKDLASNQSRTEALGKSILKAAKHTTPTDEDIRNVDFAMKQQVAVLGSLKNDASVAAGAIKRWALQVQKDSTATGQNASATDAASAQNVKISERLEEDYALLQKQGESSLESVYKGIEKQYQEQIDGLKKAAEIAQQKKINQEEQDFGSKVQSLQEQEIRQMEEEEARARAAAEKAAAEEAAKEKAVAAKAAAEKAALEKALALRAAEAKAAEKALAAQKAIVEKANATEASAKANATAANKREAADKAAAKSDGEAAEKAAAAEKGDREDTAAAVKRSAEAKKEASASTPPAPAPPAAGVTEKTAGASVKAGADIALMDQTPNVSGDSHGVFTFVGCIGLVSLGVSMRTYLRRPAQDAGAYTSLA